MSRKLFELSEKLQILAHEYGYEDFADATIQACFDASNDTEDFDDKQLTQRYRYLANKIADARMDEPEFSNESFFEDK